MGDKIFGEQDEEDEEDDDVKETEIVEGDEDGTVGDIVEASGSGIVKPAAEVSDVVAAYDKFEEIRTEVLDSNDINKISGNNYINKSGWRKVATAFNVSIETLSIDKEVDDNGVVKYTVMAKAEAPNGKTSVGSGMCASNESNHMEAFGEDRDSIPDTLSEDNENVFRVDGKWRRLKHPKEVNEHNIMAHAETRAKNRAISDLVGGGEVSAEEMKQKILG